MSLREEIPYLNKTSCSDGQKPEFTRKASKPEGICDLSARFSNSSLLSGLVFVLQDGDHHRDRAVLRGLRRVPATANDGGAAAAGCRHARCVLSDMFTRSHCLTLSVWKLVFVTIARAR